MNNPNDEYPKKSPFVMREHSDQANGHVVGQPVVRSKMNTRPIHPSNKGMVSVAVFLISSLSMGIGLLGGAQLGYDVLQDKANDPGALFSGLVAAGLAYGVGWLVGLFGVRMLGNVILPIAMKVYAWIVLAGLASLQIAIISKMFMQVYEIPNFVKYVTLFVAGLVALIGVHLIIEDHDLIPFSFPILIISLFHLYLIVYHYIFDKKANGNDLRHEYVVGDAVFFLLTSILGALMLAHLGILSRVRSALDKFFKEKAPPFVPTN